MMLQTHNAVRASRFQTPSGSKTAAFHRLGWSPAEASTPAAAAAALPATATAPASGRPRRHMAAVTAKAASGDAAGSKKKTSVLFVCLGNICRSPTAEAMFRSVVEQAALADAFDIDSCGTGGGSSNWYLPGGFSYHEGDESDPRMTAAASRRGVKLTSRSRPLQPADLYRFDYIVGMDSRNVRDILRAASHWAEADSQLPRLEEVRTKTVLMTQFCNKFKQADEVPDPYYGGASGFEFVLDLLDDACTGLLGHIQKEQKAPQ